MPQKFKNLFSRIASLENLYLAARKARKGKRYREQVLKFNFSLEKEIMLLREELLSRTYHPGPYRTFLVTDSKPREISAAPYRDRVIHHAVMNILDPLFDRTFISDCYACRKGKGTHAALRRFRTFLKSHKYVLKCDVQKYFQSINHAILLGKLEHKIKDPEAMRLLKSIIGSQSSNAKYPGSYHPGDDLFAPLQRPRGLPVGNLTSQFFGNLYLNDFDHWLKEGKQVGPYIRYVDDFCVFGNDKDFLNGLKQEITEYLHHLRLRLHPKQSRIYTLSEGINFLGFRHLEGNIKIKKQNVKRFIVRMKGLQKEFANGKISVLKVQASVQSWIAHASYAKSNRLRRKIIPNFIFKKAGKVQDNDCSSGRQLEQQ